MRDKRILWAINLYSRVNHLRVHEELIRRTYGDFFKILVYTGNELFDRFPDDVFRYKEDLLVRIPDDPSRHDTPGGHGGSHNGDRDAYNYVGRFAKDYDYIIWTAADAIFSDYSSVEAMMNRMISQGSDFMSCVDAQSTGRASFGPYVRNEFFVVESRFYERMFPLLENYEGYNVDGSLTECMERTLGERIAQLGGSRLVIPGIRYEHPRSFMHLGNLGCISTANLFGRTLEFMGEFCPKQRDHVMATCFPDGILHDVRPNYDRHFE